jgi:hypothetical protein
MSDTYGLDKLGGTVDALAATADGGIRRRRGLRIALLSLAAVILVVGAAAAGTFGYAALAAG